MRAKNIERLSSTFVKKYDLPDANTHIKDLDEIEESFSGRVDVISVNAFIMESVQFLLHIMKN